MQDTGHAQSTQPNTPCTFSQVLWSMLGEHPCLSMCIEPPRTYIKWWISVLPQTWWGPTVGWIKASLIATNVLFQRIYQLLNDTTEWKIYTKTCQFCEKEKQRTTYTILAMISETHVTHNCCELIYKDYVQYLMEWVYLNLLMCHS